MTLTATLAKLGPDFDNTGHKGVSDKHEFTLDFTARRGHRWQGDFAWLRFSWDVTNTGL